jgi:hypothetical protein
LKKAIRRSRSVPIQKGAQMKRASTARFSLLAVACLGILGLLSMGSAQADEKPTGEPDHSTSFWMKKKLDFSQQLLAGLATADFDAIVTNAQSMRSLSKVEGFIRGQTPGYRKQLRFFDEANAEIIRQAQNDNLDGAALAFTQLTMSCVNCHKHLRELKP